MPRHLRWLTPYLFLLPGLLWLAIFFVIPMIVMASVSLQEGSLGTGYTMTWNFGIYPEVINTYLPQFARSLVYAVIVTVATLVLGYPIAWTIANSGGRFKNILLLLVILPFFTVVHHPHAGVEADPGRQRHGPRHAQGLGHPRSRRARAGQPAGGHLRPRPTTSCRSWSCRSTWRIEKIDPQLVEAATDLYASRFQAFRRVTLPLSMPGVFAGSLLVFIPAVGDFVNADILGSRDTTMIGNVIQRLFLQTNAYPEASALGFVLMAAVLVLVAIYARVVGADELTAG